MKRYFVTGLLLWVPLAITVWVLGLIVGTMDKSLALLPAQWQPRVWLGRDIPGVGVVLTVLVVFVTGLLTTNFIGRSLVGLGESILARIPVVRTLYSSIKQVSDTILSPQGQAFRKALLVEYPRRGSWTLAFLTGAPPVAMQQRMGAAPELGGEAMVSVFVPTTPNPTSGFFLMLRRDEVVELDMSVDAALKYIVSMGVVIPAAGKHTSSEKASEESGAASCVRERRTKQ
ncbi:MAG: DUF502 domain-containing protein [Lautropia sp.]|nr:DUF502 domain-containing protein [Lautropia sp.]